MASSWLVLTIVAAYMVVLALIGLWVRRSTQRAKTYNRSARLPRRCLLVSMMSEFIGTTASIGTAQAGYTRGISAAWNIAALGVGVQIFACCWRRSTRDLGENTISGRWPALTASRYALPPSVIAICALSIVAVSIYASGGAVLATLAESSGRRRSSSSVLFRCWPSASVACAQ